MNKLINLYKEFTSFEGSLFKYSLSFSFLLALAPSLVIFVMLFKFDLLPIDIIKDFVMNFLPYESSENAVTVIIQFFLDRQYNLISFVITMCASFYLASRIIFSFLLISASHEGVNVPKWAVRVRSVILFILLMILIVTCVAIGTLLKTYLPVVSAIIMLIMFNMMYRALSFRKRDWSFGIVGAIFSTLMILCLASLFITVINYFTSYQDVYGPLASLVSLLLVIYLIACIIYFGFCLNLVFDDNYQHEVKLPLKYKSFYDWSMRITETVKSKLLKLKK